jgi:glycosyltransferase involved in cell wall biosynthesis
MRILTLANCPLDRDTGSGYVVMGYGDGLRALGHDVEVLGAASFELFPSLRRAIHYKQAMGMTKAALARLSRGGYDLVETYGGESWLTNAFLRYLPNRPLLVAHSNGLEPHATVQMSNFSGRRAALREAAQSRLGAFGFRRVDALVTVSHFDARYAVQNRYVQPERLLAIENPLPASYLGQPLELERPLTLGFVGSWLPRKGTRLIGEVLPPLLDEFPDWTVQLIGVGSTSLVLGCFPPRLHKRLVVIPQLRREDLRAVYRQLAIVMVPSLYESFGLVTAEAMACGCCVVATRTGLAADLVNGGEALLLPRCEATSLHDTLALAMANDALRREVAAGGYHRAQSLRWEEAVRRLASAYETWLAQHLRHQGH